MRTHTHTTISYTFLLPLQGAVNFKFGVLYAKAGQTTDDEMFSNGEHIFLFDDLVPCALYELLGIDRHT